MFSNNLNSPAEQSPGSPLSYYSRQALAVIASAALAVSAVAFRKPVDARADPGPTPSALAQEANTIVTDTAEAWANHQAPEGEFIDPFWGRGGGYGIAMIAQALVETGVSTGDESLVQDGILAETYTAGHTPNGSFEELGLSTAYIWNQAHLRADPSWQSSGPTIASQLESIHTTAVSSGAEACFTNPHCWTNLKLVGAVGGLELASGDLGVPNSSPQTGKIASAHGNVKKLLSQAVQNTGNDASFSGAVMKFRKAGILSDPTRNPLAYDLISVDMLGHTIEELGPDNTTKNVKAAFQRGARGIIGFMAPNGDGAYIGRGQGQVWNVAAEADALSIAAHYTEDPVWRGRYLAGAARAINRLQTVYTPGSWGMPLVPRLLNDPAPDHLGIDHYANSIEYNGLAILVLQNAVLQLEQTQPAPAEGIGSDSNGVFVDPSHTKFASVRHGDLWYAIHAGDTSEDARYDGEIVAAEHDVNGVWEPAMPYRPFTDKQVSAGPVLVAHGVHLVPIGDKISANQDGVVNVVGGWSGKPGNTAHVDKGTKFVYSPTHEGVRLSFNSKPSQTYQFKAFYEPGSKVTVLPNGLDVQEPNGRHETYTTNEPVNVTTDPTVYHSAYDENLDSSDLTIHTGRTNTKVSYNTQF